MYKSDEYMADYDFLLGIHCFQRFYFENRMRYFPIGAGCAYGNKSHAFIYLIFIEPLKQPIESTLVITRNVSLFNDDFSYRDTMKDNRSARELI